MTKERSVDAPRCGGCPIDLDERPVVRVSNAGSRAVFCEQGNTDGWLASDVVLDGEEMR